MVYYMVIIYSSKKETQNHIQKKKRTTLLVTHMLLTVGDQDLWPVKFLQERLWSPLTDSKFRYSRKRKTTYWWHTRLWPSHKSLTVGDQDLWPVTCHFCKSDFGHLWPTAQNLDILGPTIQQLKLSSQCHQVWDALAAGCGFAFLFQTMWLLHFY